MTQLDVDDFVDETREQDAREAAGDYAYECERDEWMTYAPRGFGPCAPEEEEPDIAW